MLAAMADPAVPTLYEWAGGMPALRRLTDVFYPAGQVLSGR